jgi:hypothetical protein
MTTIMKAITKTSRSGSRDHWTKEAIPAATNNRKRPTIAEMVNPLPHQNTSTNCAIVIRNGRASLMNKAWP